MDRAHYIQKRRKKYLAQVLEEFETVIVPLLLVNAESDAVQNFKGLVRRKMNALAVDATDVMSLTGEVNGFAVEVRDRLDPEGRPTGVRS
jgi:hypothetical protein